MANGEGKEFRECAEALIRTDWNAPIADLVARAMELACEETFQQFGPTGTDMAEVEMAEVALCISSRLEREK